MEGVGLATVTNTSQPLESQRPRHLQCLLKTLWKNRTQKHHVNLKKTERKTLGKDSVWWRAVWIGICVPVTAKGRGATGLKQLEVCERCCRKAASSSHHRGQRVCSRVKSECVLLPAAVYKRTWLRTLVCLDLTGWMWSLHVSVTASTWKAILGERKASKGICEEPAIL